MKKILILFILILTISSCFKKDTNNSLPIEKPKQNIENSQSGELIQENTGSIALNNSGTLENNGNMKKENQTIISKKTEIKTSSGNVIEQGKNNIQNTGALINTGSIVLENTSSIENKDEIRYDIIEEKEMSSKDILEYYKNILSEEDYKKLDDSILNKNNSLKVQKFYTYDIILSSYNKILILNGKLYNTNYINKKYSSYIDFYEKKYLVFNEIPNNFKIYNLEKNKFEYEGELITNLFYKEGYYKELFYKSKFGYFLKEGIFNVKNGKIYKYNNKNKYKIGEGDFIPNKLFNEIRIGTVGYDPDELYFGYICDEEINNNEEIIFYCYKSLHIKDNISYIRDNRWEYETKNEEIIKEYYNLINGSKTYQHQLKTAYNLIYEPTQTLEQFIETYKDVNKLEVKNIEDLGEDKYKTTVIIDGITYESVFQIMEDYKLKTISVKELK